MNNRRPISKCSTCGWSTTNGATPEESMRMCIGDREEGCHQNSNWKTIQEVKAIRETERIANKEW